MVTLAQILTRIAQDIKRGRFAVASNLVNADLNTLKAPGSYGYWDNALNAPSNLRGNVIVSELRTTGGTVENVYQLALERDGRMWMRDWARSGDVWRAWIQIAANSAPIVDGSFKSAQIPVGGDLNTATTPGMYGYWGQSGSIPATINAPTTARGSVLVSEILTTSGLVDRTIHLAIEATGNLYTREWVRVGAAWSAWVEVGKTPAEPVHPATPAIQGETSAAAFKTVPLTLSVGSNDQNTGWVERGLRIPIRYNAPVKRFRVHARNWNPFSTSVRTGSITITGLWLAAHPGSGVPTGTAKLMDSASTPADGSEWVSPWIDADLGGDIDRLLMLGYTGAGANGPFGIRGASWQTASASEVTDPAAALIKTDVFPLEVWIEAETPATTPVIAAVGDSISAGIGADRVLYDSWLSRYCRRVGALPLHVSASGDSMIRFLGNGAARVERWAEFAPADAVIWAMGSNDISTRPTIDAMTANFRSMRSIIERNIGSVEYATTITPRSAARWDAEHNAIRDAWNAQLRGLAEWKGILDFASVVSDPAGGIIPAYDADGVHFTSTGYQAVADSVPATLFPTAGPTAAQVSALTTRLAILDYDSGLRDITSLAPSVTSGKLLFRVKNGWARITISDVRVSTGGTFWLIPHDSVLTPWSPSRAIETEPGSVNAGATSATYLATVTNRGSVGLYGVPANTALHGSVMWPVTRPIPATPLGSTA